MIFLGGFNAIDDINGLSMKLRSQLQAKSQINKAVASDKALDLATEIGGSVPVPTEVKPRAFIDVEFPELPGKEKRQQLEHLRGMIDLDKVVVVTGFGEVGPYGNSKGRWEIESSNELSLEVRIFETFSRSFFCSNF